MTARTKLVVDGVLLLGAASAFASGLVLFFGFHVGYGCFRSEALGLSRLAWQNLHRLGAILALVGALAHAAANGRSICARCVRLLRGNSVRHDVHELALYVCNTTLVVIGFVLWLVIAGSMPILGPARLEPVPGNRHPWIDVHNLVGLLALILTSNHVRRRWRALGALMARARATTNQAAGAPASTAPGTESARGTVRWPWRSPNSTSFIAVNTRLCAACAECVRGCPHGVLGMVAIWRHRHVRIENAGACTGCRRCVRSCNHGAITAIARSGHREATTEADTSSTEPGA